MYYANCQTLLEWAEAAKHDLAAGDPAEPAVPPSRSDPRSEAKAGQNYCRPENHHKYADGGCMHLEPIGVNELARQVDVSNSTASDFFNKEFGGPEREHGHARYKVVCRDSGSLVDSIKLLRGEFSPHNLYSRQPPSEVEHGEDE